MAHLQKLEQDTMLNVRFQPTVISSEEHEFLARSLSCCQQVLRKDDAILAARAKVWFQHLENWAGGLQRGVALVSIILASNQTISPMTAQLIGSMFASGERKDLALYSGFEIQALEPDEESLICTKLHDAQALPAITVFVPEAPVDAGRLPYLLDSTEAASVFLLPPITLEAIPGLEYRHHLELDVQSSFSTPTSGEDKSVQLGMNRVGHKTQTVYLSKTDLRRHQYVIGQTGTGKTTYLQNQALELMRLGSGVIVIDPHGDMHQHLLERIPSYRAKDVIVIDPTHATHSIGLNLLEINHPNQASSVTQDVSEIIKTLTTDEYGSKAIEYMGPRFFLHLRMNALLSMSNPNEPGTLLQCFNIFQENDFYKRWLPLKSSDSMLHKWVNHTLLEMDYTKVTDNSGSFGDWISSKLHGLFFDPRMRHIFGQAHSTINLEKAMIEGKIVLINLAKGTLGIQNSRLLGMVLMSKLYNAALSRAKLEPDQRRDCTIIVDEFQSMQTESFANLLSEGRKFGVSLILANQYCGQIQNENILKSLLGNAGTLVSFRIGLDDARTLSSEFALEANVNDLLRLPNHQALVRGLQHGERCVFTLLTQAPNADTNPQQASEILQQNQNLYMRDRNTIELEIAASLGERIEPKNTNNPPNIELENPESDFDTALAQILTELKQSQKPPLEN